MTLISQFRSRWLQRHVCEVCQRVPVLLHLFFHDSCFKQSQPISILEQWRTASSRMRCPTSCKKTPTSSKRKPLEIARGFKFTRRALATRSSGFSHCHTPLSLRTYSVQPSTSNKLYSPHCSHPSFFLWIMLISYCLWVWLICSFFQM